jgi:hypothetical protein
MSIDDLRDSPAYPAKVATDGNGTAIFIDVTPLGKDALGAGAFGDRAPGDVANVAKTLHLQDVADAVGSISDVLLSAIKKAKPSEATVEFNIDVGLEAGQLTALIVKGTTSGSVRVSLTWDASKES